MIPPFLLGLTGKSGSGKDTIADMLTNNRAIMFGATIKLLHKEKITWNKKQGFKPIAVNKFGPAYHLALADPLKLISGEVYGLTFDEIFGTKKNEKNWTGKTNREVMQGVGHTFRLIHEDTWVKLTERNLKTLASKFPRVKAFIITDIRYDNEARMVDRLGGQIWEVKRPNVQLDQAAEPWRNHPSEGGISKDFVNRQITNDASLNILYDRVTRSWHMDYLEHLNKHKNDRVGSKQ